MNPLKFLLVAIAAVACIGQASLHAASQTWDGGGTDADWTTGANWSGDAMPGTAVVNASTNSADVATFSGAIANTWGESVDTAIRIDSNTAIGGLSFSGASGSYFIGNPSDSALQLGLGSPIYINNNIGTTAMTATILAPITVRSGATQSQIWNRATTGSGSGSATLVIGGSFTPLTTSTYQLYLTGENGNNNIITSDLSNGSSSAMRVETNNGKWLLTGNNSFTGNVVISKGELSAGSLNSVSGGTATSNLGAPTTVANGTISMGGSGAAVFRYTGSGETTDRVINLAGTVNSATLYQAGTGTLTFSSDFTATGAGSKTLFLAGSTTSEGRIEGAIVNNSATNKTSVQTYGTATWTLAGNNTYTGNTTVSGGTLKLDYATNNTSKLSDTGTLILSGGTLELSGGSHTEAVAGTTVALGSMTTIKRTSGTAKIALGAITESNHGVVNIEGDFATTNRTNSTSGILADSGGAYAFAVTVNGTDFGTNDGSGNIVAYTDYTPFPAGALTADVVYELAGSGTQGGHGSSASWLKITSTGANQSLQTGSWWQNYAGVLFSGADDYTINGTAGFKAPIFNYGPGVLSISNIGQAIYHYGTGTTRLTGNATNANIDFVIYGGALEISDIQQLGTQTGARSNRLDGGALLANTSGGDVTLANNGFVRNMQIGDNAGRFDVTGGGTFTISGVVSSLAIGRGLVIIGSGSSSGTVAFSGANTFTGGVRLDGGTWRIDGASASGAGEILFNGGTLGHGSGITNDFSGRFANSAGQTFSIDTNGNDVTYRVGMNSVGGNLTKLGAGTLTIGGANTYNGTTLVSAGTLALLGSERLADSSALVVNGGDFALGTANETVSSVTLTSGTISGSTGVLQSTGGFTLQSGTVSGILGGSGAVTKSGAGTVALTGENTYTGGTTVSAGTLRIGAGGTTGSVTGTITAGGGVLEFNRSDALTVSNTLAGAGTFRQIGGNTLTLDGTNTTNGTIAVTNGTILFSGAGALPASGSLSASTGGTLSVADGTTRNSTLSGGLTMDSGNFVFDINASASDLVAFSGAASLSGTNLVKLNLSNATSGSWTLMTAASGMDGGTWSLDTDSFNAAGLSWVLSSNATALTLTAGAASNNFYWTGNTSASWGTGDNWSSDSAGASPRGAAPGAGDDLFFTADTASNLSTTLGTNFTVNSISIEDPGVSIAAGNTLTANASSAQAFLVSADSGTTTIAANLAGASAGLTKSGNGSLSLSGSNSYAGATTINGGVLTISGGAAIADTGAVVLADAAGAVFSISASETIGSLQGGGSSGGNVTIASGQTLTVAETGTNTFSGVLGGAGNLVKTGAGTLVLGGANTYNGSTTISAGTLQIGAGGTTGSLGSTSGITNNGVLAFNRSDTLTISAAISGSGGVTQLGSGTTVLSATNTYNGATIISGGTLQIGDGGTSGSIASTSGITTSGVLAFNRSDVFTVSTGITGSGGLTQSGSGTLVLSGSNSYNGTTTLAAGTLRLDHANAIGTSGTVTFTGGSLLYTANNTADISSRLASSTGAITLDTNGQDVTLASSIGSTNVGGLVKNGAGTLTMTAANAYSGSTVINAGTLQIGTGGASGSLGSYSGTNNGTLVLNTSSEMNLGAAVINGTGDLIKNGSGRLTVNNLNVQLTGSVIMNSGTLYLRDNSPISSSTGFVINGGQVLLNNGNSQTVKSLTISGGELTLQNTASTASTITAVNGFVIDGGSVFDRVILAGGSLTKNGAGTFTLGGTNTYTGGVTLNSGTLVLTNTSGAGSGTITQTDGTSLLQLATTGTIANNMSIYNVASNQTVSISGNITAQNTTYDVADGTTLSLNGTISGNGGVTKNGTGTLELNAANTFTGDTDVNAGTLKANASGSLASTGNISVTGGSLLVTASNAIGDSVAVNLAGGTMAFSGNVTDSIGALTLSADSIIDLGTGSVSASFADLAMGLYNLSIYNWTGTTLWNGGDGNNTDKVYFNRALTGSELGKISFYSDFGSSFVGTGFQLMAGSYQYEVIPVPEPETWLAAVVILGGMGVAYLRRKRRASAAV